MHQKIDKLQLKIRQLHKTRKPFQKHELLALCITDNYLSLVIRKKNVLSLYANEKGTHQPLHLNSLIRIIAVCSLDTNVLV